MKRYLVAGAVAAATLAVANAEESSAPLVDTAMQFVARASSTSEVLTLNLTNLLILLVLKALIFGFGLFSVGGVAGRSADTGFEAPAFTPGDLNGGMNFLMYTAGDESKLESIQRTACEDVQMSRNYLTAAKMWYKMHKILGSIVPFENKYAVIMHAVKEAVEFGETGKECAEKYDW